MHSMNILYHRMIDSRLLLNYEYNRMSYERTLVISVNMRVILLCEPLCGVH